MKHKIWIAPYQLQPVSSLSAKVQRLHPREGTLLKVESEAGTGYADLHPWVELGDAPLNEQLQRLVDGQPTSLALRSLAMATRDASLRSLNKKAFDGLTVPESHYLVNDLAKASSAEFFAQVATLGFRTLKLKLGRNLSWELEWLQKWSLNLASFNLRFDFNGSLNETQFIDFAHSLSRGVTSVVEFVEDPVPFHLKTWQGLSVHLPLALDRSDDLDYPGVRIWKPAVQNRDVIRKARGVCVTSYLDHPVGQLHAAYEAATLPNVRVCGLVSQIAYEPHEFSEALGEITPRLKVPPGTGIGFDELLERQPWKKWV